MMKKYRLKEIDQKKKNWENTTLKKGLKRFNLNESPQNYYTPLDIQEHNFLEKVGFPGEYPFTAGVYPFSMEKATRGGFIGGGPGLVRAGRYAGYGTPEDMNEHFLQMRSLSRLRGPNLAFDLPTQIGYDSDNPRAQGEVGKVGVAVDTLMDMEIMFEAFTGEYDLDKIASNFTINAPALIIVAMYIAIAEKRNIPLSKLRGTPQNDILKEYAARGTYIFPVNHGMRLMRDSIVYFTQHLPLMNFTGMSGSHMRSGGCSRELTLGFVISNLIAYCQLGVDAGLDIDSFAPRIAFDAFQGDPEVLKEIALQRAARRMWAKTIKEKFGAKNPRSMLLRQGPSYMWGAAHMTKQRPLNNLTRAVIAGVAQAMCGQSPTVEPPFDEPLGLGWSLEAQQLSEDAARIIQYEARLDEVIDPWAGSYFMERLTDEIEEKAWEVVHGVDEIGGAAAAIENGYYQRKRSESAWEWEKEIQEGKRIVVGVNTFLEEDEIEVTINRTVPHPYDPAKKTRAEKMQKSKLNEIKKERDNHKVSACLKRIEDVARDKNENLMYPILEAVKNYASVGEICNVLREVFGEYTPDGTY